jgi:Holliday junction resolvase RusA-like endonuclease
VTGWRASFTVYGEARSQGSKRLGRAGKDGKPILIEADPRLRPWQAEVREAMRRVAPPVPVLGPVAVQLVVYVARPRSHYGTGRHAGTRKRSAPWWPAAGKDLDKQARGLADCGTGLLWRDDRQIAVWRIFRLYDPRPRIEVLAWELPPDRQGDGLDGFQPLREEGF